MRRTTAAPLVSALLLLGGCADSSSAEQDPPSAGTSSRMLPALSLEPLVAGEPALELAQVRGPAVLNLWASWCGPCRREMPVIQRFAERHPDIRVLGIDFQDRQREAALDLVRRTGVDYPMYVDPLGELSGRAPFPALRGLPYTALVDAQGRLVHGEFVEIEDVDHLERLVRRHLGGTALS